MQKAPVGRFIREVGCRTDLSVATLGGWGAVGSKVGVLTIRPTELTLAGIGGFGKSKKRRYCENFRNVSA